MRYYLKEIGINSTIYSIFNILTKAIGFILIPIYAHYLDPAEYGIISMVSTINTFIIVFYDFGMSATWNRFYFDFPEGSREQKIFLGNIFMFVFALSLSLSLFLTFFGSSVFSLVTPGVKFFPFINLGIWTGFFMMFYNLKLNLYRVRQQSFKYAIFSFCSFISIVSFTIIAIVKFKFGAIGKVASESMVGFIFFVISVYLLKKDIIFKFDFIKLKQALNYGVKLIPHTIGGTVLAFIDRFFVNHYQGLKSVAVYSLAFQLGLIMNLIIISINSSWFPFFMKMAEEKKESAKPIFAQLITYYVLAIMFIAIGISYFSKEFVQIFTTKQYYEAFKLAPIFVFSMVINGLYFIPANNIVYIKKAVKFLPIATIVAGISTIFFNFLLIPYFGVYGSAWAGIISNLICLSITFYISEKFYSIKYEYKRITMIFLITGILIIFLFFIQSLSINWWKLVLLKLVGISVYFVFFYYSGFLRVSELSNLKDILSKFIPFRKTTSSQ